MGPSRGIIQKCVTHERSPCTPKFEEGITRGNLAPRKMRPQSSMGLGEEYLQAQDWGQSYVLYFYWSQGNTGGALQNLQNMWEFVVDLGASDPHAEQKKYFKLRWTGYFAKIQGHHCGTRSCHAMDSILSVQSNDFTGVGYESFSNRHSSRKEFTLIIPWNLRKSCEDPSCRHRTDPRQMALERAARSEKEGTSAVLLQSALDEKWSADSVECCCYLRNVQDLLADWNNSPYSFWSNGWTSPDFSTRSIKISSIWQESFTRNHSWIWRVEFGKETSSLRISRNWKIWTHQKFILRRINAKEVLISQKGEEFIFPVADGTAKLSGREYEFREPTPRRERTARSEDVSGELQGERLGPQPTESKDDAEARANFWSIQGDFIFRHHSEPRVQLYVPKEEAFTTPLKHIDVTRSTHTDLDVMQEKRIDDCWNIDSNRSSSDSWKGFTKFTLLKEEPPKGYVWSGERLSKVRTTTRPDHVWPEVWSKIGKAAQNREQQERKNEKPKLDNARRLRGIYFFDPDDEEHQETL